MSTIPIHLCTQLMLKKKESIYWCWLDTLNDENIALSHQLFQHLNGRIEIDVCKRRAPRFVATWGTAGAISTSVCCFVRCLQHPLGVTLPRPIRPRALPPWKSLHCPAELSDEMLEICPLLLCVLFEAGVLKPWPPLVSGCSSSSEFLAHCGWGTGVLVKQFRSMGGVILSHAYGISVQAPIGDTIHFVEGASAIRFEAKHLQKSPFESTDDTGV